MTNITHSIGEHTSATIIADSVNQYGNRIITFSLKYWRAIHGELMTHRVFSRNAASSRAIPVAKMIEQVETNPFMQLKVGKNIPGMQAKEYLEGEELEKFQAEWKRSAQLMAEQAKVLNSMGVHKQSINRILEPWQIMQTVVTTTNTDNFYELRIHEDAEPHINALATCMYNAQSESTPVKRVSVNDWHLPYISDEERATLPLEVLLACSTARCARVSYLTHEGKVPDVEADKILFERLVGSRPLHASPCEHQAYPNPIKGYVKNFNGWVQHRALIESNLWSDLGI